MQTLTIKYVSFLGLFNSFSSFDIFIKIQRTIREELTSAIVITIAHRLKTVMDYDRILVLDEGHMVEFDTPWVLLQTPNSAFREMCRNSADWPLFLQISQDKCGSAI